MTITQKSYFSSRLFLLRKNGNLTQDELSNFVGIERATIAKYETQKRIPSYEHLVLLAYHFNVSTDYLLGLSDVSTYDVSAISASKYTGLSEKALNTIKSLTESDKEKINRLFENEKFLKLVTILSDSEVF